MSKLNKEALTDEASFFCPHLKIYGGVVRYYSLEKVHLLMSKAYSI